MVKFLFVAALAASVVTAAAPAGLEPPAISESFALLPCPAKPKTTLDHEGCAERKIIRSDKAINERVNEVFALLKSRRSAAAVARFVRGERAWLAFRRTVCRSRADVYEGGSAGPVAFAECEVQKNASHLTELVAFERDLRR